MTAGTAGYPAARSSGRNTPRPSPRCRRYLAIGHRRVHGWPPALALAEIAHLSCLQQELEIHGSLCEIGVHLGRTFILLQLLAQSDELTVGIDLHERRPVVLRNLTAHGGDPGRVKLVVEDCRALSAGDILQLCAGNPRLLNIDADRSADAVYHCLELALETLCAGGLACVDDYFQEAWPEVSEGVCRFMAGPGGLFPVAIGGNKIFFTNSRAFAQRYQERLRIFFPGQVRTAVMSGEPVLLIQRLTLRRRMTRTKLWQAIRKHIE